MRDCARREGERWMKNKVRELREDIVRDSGGMRRRKYRGEER